MKPFEYIRLCITDLLEIKNGVGLMSSSASNTEELAPLVFQLVQLHQETENVIANFEEAAGISYKGPRPQSEEKHSTDVMSGGRVREDLMGIARKLTAMSKELGILQKIHGVEKYGFLAQQLDSLLYFVLEIIRDYDENNAHKMKESEYTLLIEESERKKQQERQKNEEVARQKSELMSKQISQRQKEENEPEERGFSQSIKPTTSTSAKPVRQLKKKQPKIEPKQRLSEEEEDALLLEESKISSGVNKMNIESLIALADKLDEAGQEDEANRIDEMAKKMTGIDVGDGVETDEDKLPLTEGERDYYNTPLRFKEEALKKEIHALRSQLMGVPAGKTIDQRLVDFLNAKIEELNDVHAQMFKPRMEQFDEKKQYKSIASIKFDDDKKSSIQPALQKLAETADKLDEIGAPEEASLIDNFLAKNAAQSEGQYMLHGQEDEITNLINVFLKNPSEATKSDLCKEIQKYLDLRTGLAGSLDKNAAEKTKVIDPYDTKAHHELQVRKTQETKPVTEHHVAPYQETKAPTLSIRHCPEHIGQQMSRVSDNCYQCSIDGQIWNWETGFTANNIAYPGGSVAGQTPGATEYAIPHRIFDSREKALQGATY